MPVLARGAISLLALMVVAGAARASDARLESAEACARIAPDAERLHCFDGLFGSRPVSQAAEAPQAAPAPQATPAPQSAAAAEAAFGLPAAEIQARRSEPAAPTEISSRVGRVIQRGPEPPLLELENGQQWVLLESMGSVRFGAGDAITIRSGTLGSYLASMPERKGAWRIRRVK